MEGNSIPNPKELRISVLILPLCCFTVNMSFPVDSFSNLLSPISSSPLFSSIVSFYTLIILYFPHLFLRIAFSPVLILTGILLFTLLRLGAAQRLLENEKFTDYTLHVQTDPPEESKSKSKSQSQSQIREPEITEQVTCRSETESETEMGHPDPITCFEVSFSFVEWNVRAPLEVIYEEREGEEAEEDRKDDYSDPNPTRQFGLERSSSLSLYYPESDSDDSSDDSDLGDFPVIGEWSSPEGACLAWEEEDREGLIEIALDHGDKKCSGSDLDLGFHVEEENLIEIDIDISPTINEEFFGEKLRFSR